MPGFALTTVTDTLPRPNGGVYQGTSITITWPTFTSGGQTFYAGRLLVPVSTSGTFSVSLQPSGSLFVYSATYQLLNSVPPINEKWAVPTIPSTVNLSMVRTTANPTPLSTILPRQISQSGAVVGQCLTWLTTSETGWGACTGSATFPMLTSGTNTIAAMVVGSGASLTYTGAGTINANYMSGVQLSTLTGVLRVVTGTPLVVTGSATNCVKVDGSSDVCGAPGGLSGDIQYNNAGTFGGRTPQGDGIKVQMSTGTAPTSGTIAAYNAGGNVIGLSDPANCGAGLLPRGIDAFGVGQGCAAVNLATEVTGVLGDPNIPNLNTLSTGLTASRCVETNGSAILVSTGGPCVTSTAPYSQSFTSQTSVALTHAIGTLNVIVFCYDGADNWIQWNSLVINSTTQATVTFASAQSGRCVVNGGVGPQGAPGGGGGSNVCAWTKYTVPYTSLTAAATTQDISLTTLGALGVIQGVRIKHATVFAGTFSALTVSVDSPSAGDPDFSYYASAFDIMQTTGNAVFQSTDLVKAATVASEAVNAHFTSTGANLNTASAGSVDVWVCSAILP